MTNEDIDKKTYELALLLKDESQLAGVITLIKQHNGDVTLEPRAKKLALAYKIENYTEATFVSFQFSMFPDGAKELETDLNNSHDVIRFLILASPPAAEKHEGAPTFGAIRRSRPTSPTPRSSSSPDERTSAAPRVSAGPLSNEDLGKKIEEFS
jgi:ribosomal protein S6